MTTISDDMESMKNSAIIIQNMTQRLNPERKKLIEWFEGVAFCDQLEIVHVLTQLAYESYDSIHNKLEDSFQKDYFESISDEEQEQIDASSKIRDRIADLEDEIDSLRTDTAE